jgi:uncharacterized RDD family membrane protein YckC
MPPRARPYAGVVTRAVALVVDVVIVDAIALTVTVVVGLVLSTIIPGKQSIDAPTAVAAACAWLVFVAGYFVGFWALLARTPGMRLMGLELVAADGGEVGVARAVRRLGGMVLAAIPLGAGFLLSLVDDRRQGLQDKVAGTVVLYATSTSRGAAENESLAEARPAEHVREGTALRDGTVVKREARPA